MTTAWAGKCWSQAPYMQVVIDRFRPVFAKNAIEIFMPPVNERFEEAELLHWVGDVDGVICGDDRMKEGVWHKIPSRALRECTLGVIGIGNVGKAVVRRVIAFGVRVLGNDIIEIPGKFLAETNIGMVSKERLLRQADFVSLNCNLNPTSYHLISGAEFALMKPTAVVINTARGPVIDEPALIRALQEKRIAGVALDVFEIEPLPADNPLRRMDNVMLAPHNANSNPEAWERVHWNTIKNLVEELRRSDR